MKHRTIYTMGHSNHSIDKFISLLELYRIEVLVDVRSQPYSKYNPHFSRNLLEAELKERGFQYLYLGKELGGIPENKRFYDANGKVLYSELACSELFLNGIDRIVRGSESYSIALMCAEENPNNCHRRKLITPVLVQHNIEVLHIRGDASSKTEAECYGEKSQLSLF